VRKAHTRQKTVSVRREVDANDIRALVGHNIEEAGILVREAVVVLPPNHRRQQDVERGNLGTPFHLQTLLKPLAVLLTC